MFFFKKSNDWHGLKTVYADDIFLISYPRSGNTWMRFLLAFIYYNCPPQDLKELETTIPDIHTSLDFINEKLPRPRIIKSHFSEMPPQGKILYLYRDGRDSLISFYFYLYPNSEKRPTFLDFLNSGQKDTFVGNWSKHIQKALSFRKKEPYRIHMLKYESLVSNPEFQLSQVLKFLELSVSEENLKSAIHVCSLENLKQMEKQTRNLLPGEKPFFRNGSLEQWRDFFSDQEIRILNKQLGKTLKVLGYPEFK